MFLVLLNSIYLRSAYIDFKICIVWQYRRTHIVDYSINTLREEILMIAV